MRDLLSEANVRRLGVGWSALIIAGIFLADLVRVLPSIGVAGLFLTAISYSLYHRRIAQRAHWPMLLSFALIYFLHAFTGLPRSTHAEAALRQDLLLQAPFALLPIAFLLLPSWRQSHKNGLWLLLIGCCLLSAASATAHYALHYKAINQLYLQSKVMPTSPDHIRFSLLVSMAVAAGMLLVATKSISARLRLITLGAITLLFLFQHLLAVRSGLVTLYAAGAVGLGWVSWRLGQWKAAVLTAGLALLLAGLCLYFLPTLRNKISNTREDASYMQSVGAANNYSVTARVYSYKVAWAVVQEHPWIGVSKLQMADALAEEYRYFFPVITRDHYLLPHNQFLYNLVAYGALGLLVFLFSFYYPFWVGLQTHNMLLLLLYLIISLSFLVEYTLESHIGVLVGCFFLLLAAAPTALPGAARGRENTSAVRSQLLRS
ncbi:hypothetical protein A0257_01470 [Hymenobacter psoromatis]|nr:hypothetical protein A0257_01470 [Hymenobacter psoromatis]